MRTAEDLKRGISITSRAIVKDRPDKQFWEGDPVLAEVFADEAEYTKLYLHGKQTKKAQTIMGDVLILTDVDEKGAHFHDVTKHGKPGDIILARGAGNEDLIKAIGNKFILLQYSTTPAIEKLA